jgi:hypothetical protein
VKDMTPRNNASALPEVGAGQEVEIRDSAGRVWLGTVDIVDEENGILWIYTSLGERKLVDVGEYTVLLS